MKTITLSSTKTPSYKQKLQTEAYDFPYHYLDLLSEENRLVWEIEKRSLLQVIRQELSPFAGQRVLDAGCGDGRLCYEIRNEKVKITGVDLSRRAIAFAKLFNPKAKFRIHNFEKPAFGMGKFDQIVCQEILEHFPPSKAPKILNNLNDLLKPGGRIIFTVPSMRLRIPLKHFRHFDEATLKETLAPHFEVKYVKGYNIVSYKRKLFMAGKFLMSILLPFRSKYRIVYGLCRLLGDYYIRNLSLGRPEDALGLVAVCKKKV